MLKNHINDFPSILGIQKFKILRFIEIRLFHISLIRLISRGDHFGYSGNRELVFNEIPKDSETRTHLVCRIYRALFSRALDCF